jgi:hypothetical protein
MQALQVLCHGSGKQMCSHGVITLHGKPHARRCLSAGQHCQHMQDVAACSATQPSYPVLASVTTSTQHNNQKYLLLRQERYQCFPMTRTLAKNPWLLLSSRAADTQCSCNYAGNGWRTLLGCSACCLGQWVSGRQTHITAAAATMANSAVAKPVSDATLLADCNTVAHACSLPS